MHKPLPIGSLCHLPGPVCRHITEQTRLTTSFHEQRYRSNANGWQAIFRSHSFGLRWQSASGDTAFATEATPKSGVALRFPPQSKTVHRL
jgi:hypothetical protein